MTKPSDLIIGSEHLEEQKVEEQKEKETQRIVDMQFKMAGYPEWASDYGKKTTEKKK